MVQQTIQQNGDHEPRDQAGQEQEQELPLLLIHCNPSHNYLLGNCNDYLLTRFSIRDPSESSPGEPLETYLASYAGSVRALLCVGHAPVPRQMLSLLPCLELIVCSSAGIDFIDLMECRRRCITITNASEAFSDDVADHAVALLIDVLMKISAGDRFARAGLWRSRADIHPPALKLGGKRIGIVGLGNIGSEIVKRLLPFGCSIAYNSRKQKPAIPFPYCANVGDLAANSDAIILCCPLRGETHHMINKNVMSALGKDGVIINVGRGGLIDEKELVQCLLRKEIGGAGLDVFENEPNVPTELYALDNVVLTQHCAAMTTESLQVLQELLLANLEAFVNNKALPSLVNY